MPACHSISFPSAFISSCLPACLPARVSAFCLLLFRPASLSAYQVSVFMPPCLPACMPALPPFSLAMQSQCDSSNQQHVEKRYSRGQTQHPADDGGAQPVEAVVTHCPPRPVVKTDLQPTFVGVGTHQAGSQVVRVTCQNKPRQSLAR